jgi:hypothetical protein
MAAQAPPRAYPAIRYFSVTYYRADVKVAVPVRKGDVVWSEERHYECDHNHVTREAAKKCARALARKHCGNEVNEMNLY